MDPADQEVSVYNVTDDRPAIARWGPTNASNPDKYDHQYLSIGVTDQPVFPGRCHPWLRLALQPIPHPRWYVAGEAPTVGWWMPGASGLWTRQDLDPDGGPPGPHSHGVYHLTTLPGPLRAALEEAGFVYRGPDQLFTRSYAQVRGHGQPWRLWLLNRSWPTLWALTDPLGLTVPGPTLTTGKSGLEIRAWTPCDMREIAARLENGSDPFPDRDGHVIEADRVNPFLVLIGMIRDGGAW